MSSSPQQLWQRGHWRGEIVVDALPCVATANPAHAWQQARPVFLPGLLRAEVAALRPQAEHSLRWATALQNAAAGDDDYAALWTDAFWHALHQRGFDYQGDCVDLADEQELTRFFFAPEDDPECELWVKAAWLSLHDEDGSLRFRISSGTERASAPRSAAALKHAAGLAEVLFPESRLLTKVLPQHLQTALDWQQPCALYERIAYFNHPNGGAYLHQDVERASLGVCYLQTHGHTVWLALSLEQIQTVLLEMSDELTTSQQKVVANQQDLVQVLEEQQDEWVILLNRNPKVFQAMLAAGHVCCLQPGDVVILPQFDAAHCAWHAVYVPDDAAVGYGLSSAIHNTGSAR